MKGSPLPETGEHRDRMVAMLANPSRWPMWPKLPMKRRYTLDDSNHVYVEAGFCVTADFPTIVLKGFPSAVGIIHQLAAEDAGQREGAYEDAVVKRYDSVDDMIADGWAVD
jgi:hypothetical protein